MIKPERLYRALGAAGIEFFAGVPDSLLQDFCAYVTDHHPTNRHHITANEGNAVALAAGYHLATGTTPVVYLQNSGLGNAINPLVSLVDPAVCRLPLLLIIGWRAEISPDGTSRPDEPQHLTQGRITLPLLTTLGIPHHVLDAESSDPETFVNQLLSLACQNGTPVALVVRKNTFSPHRLTAKPALPAAVTLTREITIAHLATILPPNAVVVATTGMISRELFACRAAMGIGHHRDFLMCGSMGHASQIATGIALAKPDYPIFCFDGDGAALMHLGGLATSARVPNLTHIVLNNGCHDSVGGQPTHGFDVDFPAIAHALGYSTVSRVHTLPEIDHVLADSLPPRDHAAFIEIRVRPGSRAGLGRPTIPPVEMARQFMQSLTPPTS